MVLRWVFVILVAAGLMFGWMWFISRSEPSVEEEIVQEMPRQRRAIDGVWVPEGTPEARPLAIVIENSIDAWPISGIQQANIVFEAPTEAGIPRLLAIYADGSEVKRIGPVRSARLYYVDWAEEFGALYAHVGGSPEALRIIPSRAIQDLNEFWNTRFFWRDDSRARPHNVYTSTELLQSALDAEAVPEYESWQYKEDAPFEERPQNSQNTGSIFVDAKTDVYKVRWDYDPVQNEYRRFQNGVAYVDDTGEQVRAKNVAVMQTEIVITDEVGRRRIATVGEGEVQVFRDGNMIAGTWRRPTLDARTKFFDTSGNEIMLNAGVTWVQVTNRPAGFGSETEE